MPVIRYELQLLVNAEFYLVKSGCQVGCFLKIKDNFMNKNRLQQGIIDPPKHKNYQSIRMSKVIYGGKKVENVTSEGDYEFETVENICLYAESAEIEDTSGFL